MSTPRADAAAIGVAREDPAQPEVRALIRELDDYLIGLYDPDENHLLDIESLRAADVSFFVARVDGRALGCGAVRVIEPGVGEIKRMYVAPQSRGHGLGRRILEALEERGRELGLRELKLETGDQQPEALAMYRAYGYQPCGPFGGYTQGVTSLFFVKKI
jgi:putative acetyltransferase